MAFGMAKRIVIIDGHPDPYGRRLCHRLAEAYASGAANSGHEIRRIDIRSLEYPLLRTRENFDHSTPPKNIAAAQVSIMWANHIVIIYPLWLGTMPALLKGLLEQVIRPDFAFERGKPCWSKKLLKGRSARIVVNMGMPVLVYRWLYLSHSLRSLERNVLKFAGIGPIHETLFGMTDESGEATFNRWISQMTALGRADG
jgi:putative NADPH-quinone reductase